MTDDNRDDHSGGRGGPPTQYPLRDVYYALQFEEREGEGFALVQDIAKRVGTTRVTAFRKLKELAEYGYANQRLAGPTGLWRTTDREPTFDDEGGLVLDDDPEQNAAAGGDGQPDDGGGDGDDRAREDGGGEYAPADAGSWKNAGGYGDSDGDRGEEATDP